MKKRLLFLAGCYLAIWFFLTAPSYAQVAEWTFMVYIDADNNLEPFGITDLNEMEMVGSTADVNIVVQMDRAPGYDNSNGDWRTTRRFLVQQDNDDNTLSSPSLQDLGEVNMGDPATLTSFIQWAEMNYPANNYALVLWDHGGGWQKKKAGAGMGKKALVPYRDPGNAFKSLPFGGPSAGNPIRLTGVPSTKQFPKSLQQIQRNTTGRYDILKNVCSDETDGDILYNHEVSGAISSSGVHLSLIGFDACLMAMIENAFPLRNLGDVMVAAEETEPAPGWPYETILTELINTPSMTPADLGSTIVEKYGLYYDAAADPTTLAAIDLSLISNVAQALDEFADAITANGNLWDAVDQIRQQADKYYIPEHKDLWHVADLMPQISTDNNVVTAANDLKAAVSSCVIDYYSYSPDYDNSRGLAIYFPDATNYNAHYGEVSNGIDFMQQNGWDEFLISYFDGAQGNGEPGDPVIDYGKDIYEPNNNLALSYGPLKNDIYYLGYLIDDKDVDIFRLEIPAVSDISIGLEVPADFDLYLIQPDGIDYNVLASSEEYGTIVEEISGTIDPGVYYVAVTTYDNNVSQSNYTLYVNGIEPSGEPVVYNTALSYDFGDPGYYIWGTAMGDAAACLYQLPSVPAKLNKVYFNIQDLDAGGLGGDGTFYLFAADYYGSLLEDTIRQLTPPDTGWIYVDLSEENIFLFGDFLLSVMYDGFNTPGLGYDTTKSFGNNLFFSTDYEGGYDEDPGTYFIRAEIEYYVSGLSTGTPPEILEPDRVVAFPNPFGDNADLKYTMKRSGDVEIFITDMQGRTVTREVLRNQPSGLNTYRLIGKDLSPGIYLVQLTMDGTVYQKKLIHR